jgi:hypothetical protein
VSHVKQFAADNNLSYGCAPSMAECKDSYKNKKESTKESKKVYIRTYVYDPTPAVLTV